MSNILLINAIRAKLLTIVAIQTLVDTNHVFKYYLHENLKDTGKSALVVDVGSGIPPEGNTSLNRPIGRIWCYADHDTGVFNAEDKCWQLYHEVNNIMSFQQHQKQNWSGVHILNSIKATEPVHDKDKNYDLDYVYVTYNMEVIYDSYR